MQTRLENYHKKIMQELKDLHSDMVEKLGEMHGHAIEQSFVFILIAVVVTILYVYT